jgi:hypothetical protein
MSRITSTISISNIARRDTAAFYSLNSFDNCYLDEQELLQPHIVIDKRDEQLMMMHFFG